MLFDLLAADNGVSRETIERLQAYEALLTKWNKAINLVSPATLSAAWSRHIVDSAQIFGLAPSGCRKWVDLGSGGGFPGLVVAIVAAERNPEQQTILIEADQRKATFLREVARATNVTCSVISERIEAVQEQHADVVSARALAPLDKLLGLVVRHMSSTGRAILLKGAGVESELTAARHMWTFDHGIHQSLTDPSAFVFTIENIQRL